MAEALMARRIRERDLPATVTSAGLLEGGWPSPPEIVELFGPLGIDMGGRRSRQLRADDLDRADLVLTMERAHVRAVTVMTPAAWSKTFTLKEVVRRAAAVGRLQEGETVAGWRARVQGDRLASSMLGQSGSDDVADPYGGPRERYRATMEEIDELVTELADLIWPRSPAPSSGLAPVTAPSARRSRFGLARRS